LHDESPSDPLHLPANHTDLDLAAAFFEVILLDLEDGIIVRLFFIGAPRQSGHPLRGTALDKIYRDDFNYFGFQPCVTLMPFSRNLARHTIL